LVSKKRKPAGIKRVDTLSMDSKKLVGSNGEISLDPKKLQDSNCEIDRSEWAPMAKGLQSLTQRPRSNDNIKEIINDSSNLAWYNELVRKRKANEAAIKRQEPVSL
jgi:hypothetical protein